MATADFGSFTNGVATAATVPDSRFELVLGSGATTRATVRVYDLSSSTPRVIDTIRPFGNDAQGGVWVNVARVDRDITPDIIVGAGQRGGGKVEVYDGTVTQAPNPKLHSLNAFASLGSSSAPVEASGGDIDSDGIADLLYVTRRGRPADALVRGRAQQPAWRFGQRRSLRGRFADRDARHDRDDPLGPEVSGRCRRPAPGPRRPRPPCGSTTKADC